MLAVLVIALELTLLVVLRRAASRNSLAVGYLDAAMLSLALHVYVIGPIGVMLFADELA
jgi:hypothetical protein